MSLGKRSERRMPDKTRWRSKMFSRNDMVLSCKALMRCSTSLSMVSSELMALESEATCLETNSTMSASKSMRTSNNEMKRW